MWEDLLIKKCNYDIYNKNKGCIENHLEEDIKRYDMFYQGYICYFDENNL